jgi:hypothetical protein
MEVEGVECLSRWNSEAKICNRFFPPSIGLYLQFDSVTRLIFTINFSRIEQPSFLETLLWRISLLGNRLTRIWEDLQVFLDYRCRWESVTFSCFLASFPYLLPNKIISTPPPPPPWYALVCVLKKKYSPVCVFLLPLLNSILAPTCKMDYLVFLCWLHRQIRNEGFNRNTINLHIFCYFFPFKYYHRSPDFDKIMV